MRAGPERLLSGVIQLFGCAQAHHGYLFADARATRMNLLVHVSNCPVPCDHIPVRSWPLFKARQLMRGVIESLQGEKKS